MAEPIEKEVVSQNDQPSVAETSPHLVIPEQDQGKEPWDMSWGIEAEEAPTAPTLPEDKKDPWDRDWGISSYIQVIPRAASFIQNTARDMGFDTVFNKLINAESRGKHTDSSGKLLTSSKGAQGITQVMPKTGKDPGYGVTPIQNNSPEEFIRFGRDYLQAMLREYQGDYRKAVAAYNAGPGSVNKAVATATEKGGDWTQYLPKKSETIPYMDKILGTTDGRLT